MNIPIIEKEKVLNTGDLDRYNISLSEGELKLADIMGIAPELEVYQREGYVQSPPIDLGQTFREVNFVNVSSITPDNTQIRVYTSTSNNLVDYSEFEEINPDNTINSPRGRYIRIKIEFVGKNEDVSYLASGFNSNDSSNYTSGETIVFDEGISFKKHYQETMGDVAEFTGEGKVVSTTVRKSNFKKIESIRIYN